MTMNVALTARADAEAEYTFRLHKSIIPLRLEPRYNPDGWLGALCGNNLIYDFSVAAKYDDSFDGLVGGLSRLHVGDTHAGCRLVDLLSPHTARWRGTVVERRSPTGELSLSCARPAADG